MDGVEIEITGNAFVKQKKQIALQKLAALEPDVLEKLAELSQNEKAVNVFMNPPSLMKSFLGIK